MFNANQNPFDKLVKHINTHTFQQMVINGIKVNIMFNANQSFLVWSIFKCWYILIAGCYHDSSKSEISLKSMVLA